VTTVEFSLAAERDLIDIILYDVAQFGAVRAERYLDAINAKADVAAIHPDFGADYSFVSSGLRRYDVMSHAIYFRPTQDGILVLRVLHGRMDPARHVR
jgi:toxin ParE1/3/4